MREQINKLCPFCGGNDCLKGSGDGFPLIPNCLFEATTYAEVIERYNVRPLEDALQAKLDVVIRERDYRPRMDDYENLQAKLDRAVGLLTDVHEIFRTGNVLGIETSLAELLAELEADDGV